jgi:Flp pilus assembly protein TadD
MSLLIKALDHLEKNKQAEKDKKQTGKYVADQALTLELAPVEEKELTLAVEPSIDEEIKDTVEDLEFHSELSLEEEAGLTRASLVNRKYAKPKPNVAKSTGKITTPVIETKVTPLIEAKTPSVKNQAPRLSGTASSAIQNSSSESGQKAAAKVFVANKEVEAPSSKITLITMGVVGALLVWLGLQGYSYIKTLATPEVAKPVLPIQQEASSILSAQEVTLAPKESSVTSAPSNQKVQPVENNTVDSGVNAAESVKTSAAALNVKSVQKTAEELTKIKRIRAKKAVNVTSSDEGEFSDSDAGITSVSKRTPLALVAKSQSPGVDPILLSAYQAYIHGENALAQQQYRQVLQRDVRNVDALLGMAAIAQRQGRDADAAGWYQKVLEVEPKNPIALSANLNPQVNTDVTSAESHIKNMLTQQPDGANLHEALGNLYAEQNQWSSAQEAYFNASRLAPNNADYAFNLAVSLDQMGKSSLALKHYQRALDLLYKSGGSSPDRTQLEARIRELQ